ncbi:MAG: DUF1292 domain-containing protein [Clostridia bacterium]|nr:DUF1292 domain-containing protein [Clostridia bacterium]
MNEEALEKDLIELTSEDGDAYTFEVYDYFFYNGEEYAILQDPDEDESGGKEKSIVIMKVNPFTDENGEELEEFVPIEEELMEALIQVARTRILEETDEENG